MLLNDDELSAVSGGVIGVDDAIVLTAIGVGLAAFMVGTYIGETIAEKQNQKQGTSSSGTSSHK
jgi:hypothetical protein